MKLAEEEIKKEDLKEEAKEEKAEAEVKEETKANESEKVEEKKDPKKEKKDKHKEAISKLEKEIAELKEKNKELRNDYLKAYAELENAKKRIKEDSDTKIKYASQNLVGELIQPINMLKMIVDMPAPSDEVKNYVIGFQMITNQLVDILQSSGLAPINVEVGKEFDPKVMTVIDTAYDESYEENVVLTIKQPGYMYKDRVLKTAMVIVNKKPKEEAKEEPKENKEQEIVC